MIIALFHRTSISQSVAKVQLTVVVSLRAVSHRFNFFSNNLVKERPGMESRIRLENGHKHTIINFFLSLLPFPSLTCSAILLITFRSKGLDLRR